MDTRAFRLSLHDSDRYHAKGLGHGAEVTALMHADYDGRLIQRIRANDHRLQRGDVTIRLAEALGFCWGVERAVAMAYETPHHFPGRRIWITAEIIHNPFVNEKLRGMSIEFIPVRDGEKDFSQVGAADVVIIPGAGTTLQEMQILKARGCTVVDTTCPWVTKVWNVIEKHHRSDYTSIIHGTRNHDETAAHASFAGRYLIVQNLAEAEAICDYILDGGDKAAFLSRFSGACSPGFDPDRDLERTGIANQTTMLKSETEAIGALFERALMRKYGVTDLSHHFLPFNTICRATQERQDAMATLLRERLDLVVVVGGLNSSNTRHLHAMALRQSIPAYLIDGAGRIGPGNRIEHQTPDRRLEVTEGWLPAGPIVVGITSGASTPDALVAQVIRKILRLKTPARRSTARRADTGRRRACSSQIVRSSGAPGTSESSTMRSRSTRDTVFSSSM
jgi:4-hydroxy-3-methylbut-2-enyl diphosphate reductase